MLLLKGAQKKSCNLRSAALEAAANGIVITDRSGAIVWANHAFTTMTGYSKEEVLGKNHRMLKSEEQTESYYAELGQPSHQVRSGRARLSTGERWNNVHRGDDDYAIAQNVGQANWTHFRSPLYFFFYFFFFFFFFKKNFFFFNFFFFFFFFFFFIFFFFFF